MIKLSKPGAKTLIFSLVFVLFAISAIPAYILIQNSRKTENTVKGASVEKPKFVTLQIFKPGVMVKTINNPEFVQAIEGQELLEGTTIKTDSEGQAEIVFTNGSSTRVDVDSEVTLSTYQQAPFNSTLTLGVGRIWSRVAKLLGNESYQTKSKDVVATVRGTSYGHHVLPTGEDNMIVTKGEILSVCENGNQTAVIQKDQWGTFDCGKNAPKMGAIDDSVKDDWFNLNIQEDQKIEDLYGTETFDDVSPDVLGTTEITTLSKLQFDSTLKLYYFSETSTKTFSPSLTNYLLNPTPTPTPSSSLRDPSLINTYTNLKTLATPTPTPTTLKLDSGKVLDTTKTLLSPSTPTPTPTSTIKDPSLIDTTTIFLPATPTPTPNPLYLFRR